MSPKSYWCCLFPLLCAHKSMLLWAQQVKNYRGASISGSQPQHLLCRIWKPLFSFLPNGPRVKCFCEHTLEGNSKHQCDFGDSVTVLDKVVVGVPYLAAPGLPDLEAPL